VDPRQPDIQTIATRRQAARRRTQARHWRFYRARSDWSYIQNFAGAPITWHRERGALAALCAVVAFLSFVVVPSWASVHRSGPAASDQATFAVALPPPPPVPGDAPKPGEAAGTWNVRTVQRGQTLAALFASEQLPAALLHRLLETTRHRDALAKIRPGQQFGFQRHGDGSLAAFRFDVGDTDRIVMRIDGASIAEDVERRELQRRVSVAAARIEQSLFGAGDEAGLSDATIMQLANVFAYDIDFAQDLRRGDSFSVIYEQVYQEGERVRDGAILAAEFINGGRRHVALRFEVEEGRFDYFDPDGRSLRKAFLRTPVEFSRISSRFSAGRMHPVLGRMRAHRGVDYAAPTGTPIRAAGDGKVQFRGWQGGYGNVVIVEHGGRYTTLYGHLSRFASGVRVGSRVGQGEVIGYVGMTGLATGPHLHYEFRVAGTHRDPLTVELPKADPLAGADLRRFRAGSAPLVAQLELIASRDALAAR
jgi:murein DD-endopeptidase MepM/ murein hydrolase activator NlpD